MDRMEKLALKRLGWSVAGLGMFGVTRAVRRRYGVRSVGRVPFPVALGVVGVSALVRHQQAAADQSYWYEKGRQDEAADFEADNEALREVVTEDDGARIPFRGLPDFADLPTGTTGRARLNQVILALEKQDERIEKLGQLRADQVEAAVERVLWRQESMGQHPSDGGVR